MFPRTPPGAIAGHPLHAVDRLPAPLASSLAPCSSFCPTRPMAVAHPQDGQVIGSALIGQNFTSANISAPRPSALNTPYDATSTCRRFQSRGPPSAALSEDGAGPHCGL